MARGQAPDKYYIGIDNGVSGSIGVVNSNATVSHYYLTPTRLCLNYTKEAKNINRVCVVAMEKILSQFPSSSLVLLERPMVNPGRFAATASALRALEATLIVLERLGMPFVYIDSKEWQTPMLPKGIKGSDALKAASLDVGSRLFPHLQDLFKGDADGILIAENARRMRL